MQYPQEKKKISRLEFDSMGREWTALDTEYDNLFQEFLDNPSVKTAEDIARFKAMQSRLYAIELELYRVAEGEMTIQD